MRNTIKMACVFRYFYSLLLEKGLHECQNVSVCLLFWFICAFNPESSPLLIRVSYFYLYFVTSPFHVIVYRLIFHFLNKHKRPPWHGRKISITRDALICLRMQDVLQMQIHDNCLASSVRRVNRGEILGVSETKKEKRAEVKIINRKNY